MPCTRRLGRGDSLVFLSPVARAVFCCAGRLSIALHDGTAPVLLAPGERYAAKRNARLTITCAEGAKNEWLADTGVAVLALLSKNGDSHHFHFGRLGRLLSSGRMARS